MSAQSTQRRGLDRNPVQLHRSNRSNVPTKNVSSSTGANPTSAGSKGKPKRKVHKSNSSRKWTGPPRKSLSDLPPDIFFDLSQHLNPLDLLQLARTTKNIRAFLMQRSAALAWKTARANIKGYSLPECPDGMSEPGYANFMFTKHCHLCLTPEALHVFPAQMVRYCRHCVDDKVIWSPLRRLDLCKSLPLVEGYSASSLVYPYLLAKDVMKFTQAWLRQDYEEVVNEFRQLPGPRSQRRMRDFCEARKEIVKRQDEWAKQDWKCARFIRSDR